MACTGGRGDQTASKADADPSLVEFMLQMVRQVLRRPVKRVEEVLLASEKSPKACGSCPLKSNGETGKGGKLPPCKTVGTLRPSKCAREAKGVNHGQLQPITHNLWSITSYAHLAGLSWWTRNVKGKY